MSDDQDERRRSLSASPLWQRSSRWASSSSRRRDQAASSSSQQQHDAIALRLSHAQRKLLSRLSRFIESGGAAVNVLVAHPERTITDAIEDMLTTISTANANATPHPLPFCAMRAHSAQGVMACLSTVRVDIALVSSALMFDYASVLLDEKTARDSSAVYILLHDDGREHHDAVELYRLCAAQDQLSWPSSERLVRSVLHKWMPRSGLTMTASPPTASPPSEPAVAPQALYSPLQASGRPRGANDDASTNELYLRCPLRLLIVSSCSRSAATLIHYCQVSSAGSRTREAPLLPVRVACPAHL